MHVRDAQSIPDMRPAAVAWNHRARASFAGSDPGPDTRAVVHNPCGQLVE